MIKRFLDIILSTIALLILSPLLIPIMVILKLTGEGYIFYKQERIGQNQKSFNLLKFATMFKDSPNMIGGNITRKNDSRIFPFGAFLRKYKINEFPQIINILLGDMSIIGRRPTVKEHYDYFDEETKNIISKYKPGLSGISSIIFRDEEKYFVNKKVSENKIFYKKQIAPFKGELEVWYCTNQSLIVDILLINITILSVVKPSSNLHNYIFNDLPKHPLFNPS
jgi:lipopolysaccharide/colanic/teichoic acid biosynthesis glycosyltransferase